MPRLVEFLKRASKETIDGASALYVRLDAPNLVWSPTYHPERIWMTGSETGDDVVWTDIRSSVPELSYLWESKPNICGHCDAVAETGNFKKCLGCRCVRYCSRKCQIRHWKAAHRTECAAGETCSLSDWL
jgi:hypothetical protein